MEGLRQRYKVRVMIALETSEQLMATGMSSSLLSIVGSGQQQKSRTAFPICTFH